jgi:hypothetical protein
VDFDALIERLLGDLFLPLVLGLVCVFVYFVALARAWTRAREMVAIARECRRRRLEEEALFDRVGYAPNLPRLRRLEAELLRRLERAGVR